MLFEWMLTLFRIFSAELPATLPEELLKKQFIWQAYCTACCFYQFIWQAYDKTTGGFAHEIDGMELPWRMQVS